MQSGFISLLCATIAFVGTHLLMSHPLRPALVKGLGERAFLGVYSLVSFLTLGWMVAAGWMMAPVMLAAPLLALWPLASVVMLLAGILIIALK